MVFRTASRARGVHGAARPVIGHNTIMGSRGVTCADAADVWVGQKCLNSSHCLLCRSLVFIVQFMLQATPHASRRLCIHPPTNPRHHQINHDPPKSHRRTQIIMHHQPKRLARGVAHGEKSKRLKCDHEATYFRPSAFAPPTYLADSDSFGL